MILSTDPLDAAHGQDLRRQGANRLAVRCVIGADLDGDRDIPLMCASAGGGRGEVLGWAILTALKEPRLGPLRACTPLTGAGAQVSIWGRKLDSHRRHSADSDDERCRQPGSADGCGSVNISDRHSHSRR